jgi:hypothetical protein
MLRGDHVRPGWALVVLALLILVIVAVFDLSQPRSSLAALWNRSFRSETEGERLRDDLLEQFDPKR